MKIRFYNGLILTENGQELKATDCELHTNGKKITYIGGDTFGGQFDREVNLNGNMVIAGFKNCHTHSPMSLLRSNADDLPLLKWLNEQIFPLEKNMTPEDIYWGQMLAILEYVQGGITACSDMYFYEESIFDALRTSGFKGVTIYGASDFGDKPFDKTLARAEQLFNKCNKDDNVFFRYGIHAEYTTTSAFRKEFIKLAHSYNEGISTHLSEGRPETEAVYKKYGVSPVKLLSDEGFFEKGGCIYHGVHLSDDDILLLKKNNVTVVTNSGSNVKLASGIARLCDLKNAGVNIALGTDGAASNNSLDFFREMHLATTMQKIKCDDASAMPADIVLKMATIDGANALKLNGCDGLKQGNFADLAVIDLNQPNMQPKNNVIKNLVYSGSTKNVVLTMVNGKILYEKGEFYVGESAEVIYSKCNEIIARLKA